MVIHNPVISDDIFGDDSGGCFYRLHRLQSQILVYYVLYKRTHHVPREGSPKFLDLRKSELRDDNNRVPNDPVGLIHEVHPTSLSYFHPCV